MKHQVLNHFKSNLSENMKHIFVYIAFTGSIIIDIQAILHFSDEFYCTPFVNISNIFPDSSILLFILILRRL